MAEDMTAEVTARLTDDQCGWLTTVARSGRPVPKLIWFYFDGTDVVVYSSPQAAKVRHIRDHPQVSLNLDSDGRGSGIVVVGGTATIDAEGVDPRHDEPYWQKFRDTADRAGLTDMMGNFDTRLRISVEKVWTTPSV